MLARLLARLASHPTETFSNFSFTSIFKFLLWLLIILFVVRIVYFFLRRRFFIYLHRHRTSKKWKQKISEFERNHPPRKGHEADLAFGALFINSTTQTIKVEPTRSLQMMTIVKYPAILKEADLEKYWGIVDTKTAKECLNDLRLQQSVLMNYGQTENLKIALSQLTEEPTFIAYDEVQKKSIDPVEKIKFYLLPIIVKRFNNAFNDPKNRFTWKELSSVTDIAAWDIERLAGLARKCYVAGYITEKECYEYLAEARKQALEHYNSWREYFIGFIYGRALIYDVDSILQYTQNIPDYLEAKDSIWREYDYIWK